MINITNLIDEKNVMKPLGYSVGIK